MTETNNIPIDPSWTASSFGYGGFSCIATARVPIRFQHPDGTFGLNLNPCHSSSGFYELPLNWYTGNIWQRQWASTFGGDFDSTTLAYVRGLLMVTHGDARRLLYDILHQQAPGDIAQELSWLRSQYGFEINLDHLEEGADAASAIFQAFEASNIAFEAYLMDRWLGAGDGLHPVTALELRDLRHLFGGLLPPDPIVLFHTMMTPSVSMGLKTKYLGIEISPTMLQPVQVRASFGDGGENSTAMVPIVATVSDLGYQTGEGVSAEIEAVCSKPAELAGTGVVLTLQKVRLLDTESSRELHLYHSPAPQSVPESLWLRSLPERFAMPRFTGLWVSEAQLQLPVRGLTGGAGYLEAKAVEMVLNNHLFACTMEVPGVMVGVNLAGRTIVLLPGDHGQMVEVTMDQLAAHFRGLGFDAVQSTANRLGQLALQLVKWVD